MRQLRVSGIYLRGWPQKRGHDGAELTAPASARLAHQFAAAGEYSLRRG